MDAPCEPDAVTRRLWTFADQLEKELGPHAVVERDDSDSWAGATVRPTRSDACGIEWVEFGNEVVLSIAGGLGGRWELDRTTADLDFLEDVVRSVIAGRVVEVSAGDRSRVEVTLADGSSAVETGSVGIRSVLPKPGWQRWGRRTEYAPYQQ